MRSRIGISFLTWAEDSPLRGAVKVPAGFRIDSDSARRRLPLPAASGCEAMWNRGTFPKKSAVGAIVHALVPPGSRAMNLRGANGAQIGSRRSRGHFSVARDCSLRFGRDGRFDGSEPRGSGHLRCRLTKRVGRAGTRGARPDRCYLFSALRTPLAYAGSAFSKCASWRSTISCGTPSMAPATAWCSRSRASGGISRYRLPACV